MSLSEKNESFIIDKIDVCVYYWNIIKNIYMKLKYLLLIVLFLSSITVIFPRGGDIGAGEGD